jgi:hypothetical protein
VPLVWPVARTSVETGDASRAFRASADPLARWRKVVPLRRRVPVPRAQAAGGWNLIVGQGNVEMPDGGDQAGRGLAGRLDGMILYAEIPHSA